VYGNYDQEAADRTLEQKRQSESISFAIASEMIAIEIEEAATLRSRFARQVLGQLRRRVRRGSGERTAAGGDADKRKPKLCDLMFRSPVSVLRIPCSDISKFKIPTLSQRTRQGWGNRFLIL
jgi:hypothetical protein